MITVMLNWMNVNAGAVQGIATVILVLVTLVYVAITFWYARVSEHALQESRRQFSEEWKPLLYVEVDPNRPDASLDLAIINVGKPSVVVRRCSLQDYGNADAYLMLSTLSNSCLISGQKLGHNLLPRLVEVLGRTWKGVLVMTVSFAALGEEHSLPLSYYDVVLASGVLMQWMKILKPTHGQDPRLPGPKPKTD